MLCLDHAICSRDIKVTSYWSTNRLRIFQYFEFKFLFTFENAKLRDVIVLNENERDHYIFAKKRYYFVADSGSRQQINKTRFYKKVL